MIALNYFLRSLIVITGIFLVITGIWSPEFYPDYEPNIVIAFGVMATLWGAYRLSIYRLQREKDAIYKAIHDKETQ